ncbi:MAG: hypothetical protein ACRYFS_16300 [Janthinobacterium lividum]
MITQETDTLRQIEREKLNHLFEGLARVGASTPAVAMALMISLRKARREMASAHSRLDARKPKSGCTAMTSLLERENNCRLPLSHLLERAEERQQRILRTFDRAEGRSTSICIRE